MKSIIPSRPFEKAFRQGAASFMALLFITGLAQAAIITVDSSADLALPSDNGDCTLREALKAAEDDIAIDGCAAGSGADTLRFASGINSITIVAGQLMGTSNPIRHSLNIEGPGVDLLEISGGDAYQLFYIDSLDASQVFSFSDLSLVNGLGTGYGGGIYKRGRGTLNLTDMRFENNTAASGGGAVSIFASTSGSTVLNVLRSTFENNSSLKNGGGAIRASLNSQTDITDSTFSNNTSTGTTSHGGAIFLFSTFGPTNGSAQIDILRSTFQNNTANSSGGAIELRGASASNITASIRHSTIVSNQADLDQSDAFEYSGGGIYIHDSTTLTLANTIVAGNTDHVTGSLAVYDDIAMDKGLSAPTSSITTEGTNFIGANNTLIVAAFPTGNPNVNDDYVGTDASKLIPDLQALADNGGPTMTLLPTADGNLVDKGSCVAEPYDQRGFGNNGTQLRLVDIITTTNGTGSVGCDIGAAELSAQLLTGAEEQSTCFPIRTANGKAAIVCM